jgi:hypothetical protein
MGQINLYQKIIKDEILNSTRIPIPNIVSIEKLSEIIEAEVGFQRERIFTPMVTLWTFVNQIFGQDHSCRDAINSLAASLSLEGKKICTSHTGSFCNARRKLSEDFFSKIALMIGAEVDKKVTKEWRWKNKIVKLVDGTTVSGPDTIENQSEYPQPLTQKTGLGFPIIRLVGIISLSSGCLLDLAMGKYKGKGTGETSLLRQIFNNFQEGEVALVDRYFCGFHMISMFLSKGVDLVARQSTLRKIDFRRGTKLGKDDHLIILKKNRYREIFLGTDEEFEQLPKEIQVREVKITIEQKGFRVKEMILVTTFCDHNLYTKDDLAALYKKRWNIEVDLRSIKCDLSMDRLRCKTPAMLRKEIWCHFIGYNLIRYSMCQAAMIKKCHPREISFKGTLQSIRHYRLVLSVSSGKKWEKHYFNMLKSISCHKVGNRPDRYEPRAVKYRGKMRSLLTIPRAEARKKKLYPKSRRNRVFP